jgi:hypothetical protein
MAEDGRGWQRYIPADGRWCFLADSGRWRGERRLPAASRDDRPASCRPGVPDRLPILEIFSSSALAPKVRHCDTLFLPILEILSSSALAPKVRHCDTLFPPILEILSSSALQKMLHPGCKISEPQAAKPPECMAKSRWPPILCQPAVRSVSGQSVRNLQTGIASGPQRQSCLSCCCRVVLVQVVFSRSAHRRRDSTRGATLITTSVVVNGPYCSCPGSVASGKRETGRPKGAKQVSSLMGKGAWNWPC